MSHTPIVPDSELYTAVKRAIDKMGVADMQRIRDHLVQRLQQVNRAQFRRGDLVECTFKGGETIRFFIHRINPTTVSGIEHGGSGRRCRADPALCRLVGGDRIPAAAAKTPKAVADTKIEGFGSF